MTSKMEGFINGWAKNNKVLSLKLPEKALNILAQYEHEIVLCQGYVFPEMRKANLDSQRDIRLKVTNGSNKLNFHLNRVAKKMGLDKPLTMHIAWHTFGNISGDKIPVQMLQKLYRHSELTE